MCSKHQSCVSYIGHFWHDNILKQLAGVKAFWKARLFGKYYPLNKIGYLPQQVKLKKGVTPENAPLGHIGYLGLY